MSGGFWSSSYIWNRPSQDCNYSLQVASDRSYAADEEERSEFLQALADRVINPNQLIFLDESQKDRNSSRRRRCWSKKRFRTWVEEKWLPLLSKHEDSAPRYIVLMDNASIHRDSKDLIESNGAKLIYTAPSPDLNPIELMFGLYKAALRRQNKEPWDRAIIMDWWVCDSWYCSCLLSSLQSPTMRAHPFSKGIGWRKGRPRSSWQNACAALMSALLLNKQHLEF